MPDDDWIREQLADLVAILRERSSQAAVLLRALLGKVFVSAIIPRGKKRGYPQLRFQINGWQALLAILGEHLPQQVLLLSTSCDLTSATSPEFQLAVGAPTRMDELAPQIAAWRDQKVPWKEICRRTGIKLANAYAVWKRYVSAS
jgi:hypothetical protein